MKKKIRIQNEYVGFNREDNWVYNEYKTTLKYGSKQMTIPFKMRTAHANEPDVETVVDCLISDRDLTNCYKDVGFETWAIEMGYDPDSRKAERIYKQMLKQTEKFENLIGSDMPLIEKQYNYR